MQKNIDCNSLTAFMSISRHVDVYNVWLAQTLTLHVEGVFDPRRAVGQPIYLELRQFL
jgi:hypothetical protein